MAELGGLESVESAFGQTWVVGPVGLNAMGCRKAKISFHATQQLNFCTWIEAHDQNILYENYYDFTLKGNNSEYNIAEPRPVISHWISGCPLPMP